MTVQAIWPSWALVFSAALVITVLPIPLIRRLARQLGAVAMPTAGDSPREPIPLLGGIAIVAGLVLAFCAFTGPTWFPEHALPIVIALCATLAIGIADDILEFRARTKLALQVVVVAWFAIYGITFTLTGYGVIDRALTGVWLLIAMNAFNLIDGRDGLATGVGIAATLGVAAIAALHGHSSLVTWALALGGALAGFMLFNFRPASIFMGDAGALAVGLLLGVFAIRVSNFEEYPRLIRAALPLLLMAVPLLDVITVMVTRAGTGKPISRRGLDHTHDRLARLGLSELGVVVLLCVVEALGSAAAIALVAVPPLAAVLILPFVGLPFALFALFLMDQSFDEPGALTKLPGIARLILSLGYKRRVVEIGLDAVLIAAAYCGAFLLSHEFELQPAQIVSFVRGLECTVAASLVAFLLTGVHRGMWRYTGLDDALRFAKAAFFAEVLTIALCLGLSIQTSVSQAAIFPVLLFNFLLVSRFSFRILMRMIGRFAAKTSRMVVIGAGDGAEEAVHHVLSQRGNRHILLGFIDNDEFKLGKFLYGRRVLGPTCELRRIHDAVGFNEILIASDSRLSAAEMHALVGFAREQRVTIRRFMGFAELNLDHALDRYV